MTEISYKRYEELRLILEKQNGRSYMLEEAKEIGDGLIDFYNLLVELENEKEEVDDDESTYNKLEDRHKEELRSRFYPNVCQLQNKFVVHSK